MLGRWRYHVAHGLAAAAHAPAARRFGAALENPEAAQRAILARLVRDNARTVFGREHDFASIRTPADFQAAVPDRDHAALAPWLDRALAGERQVLTAEPVLMAEKTSGSARAAKYIPYTAGLRAEFQEAAAAWLFDLWARRPGLRRGGSYWSVSPAARKPETTPGGHPVGFTDDTEYFSAVARWTLRHLMVVPGTVAHLPDMEAVRRETLRRLVRTPRLTLVSVWNPSFLTLLIRAMAPLAADLLCDLPRDRALALQRAIDGAPDRFDARALWPDLDLVSCWTDASAALALPDLRRMLPDVAIQGKGLLSTEGVVSIPLVGHPGAALAVTSHFLEFAPEGAPAAPVLAHELDPGGRYEVLLTTGGGLYRYRTGDAVEVVGRARRTPLVRFVGKKDQVSDMCGEKLAALHVEGILGDLLPPDTRFAMVAPEAGPPPHYVLFVEAARLPDPADLDRRMRENPHYSYCRDLGQLGPARVQRVEGGPAAYLAGCEALGQRAGNVKPAALRREVGWSDRLGVRSRT